MKTGNEFAQLIRLNKELRLLVVVQGVNAVVCFLLAAFIVWRYVA